MKNKNINEEKKLTLEEYKAKYGKREYKKAIKAYLNLITVGVGIVIVAMLIMLCIKCYEFNNYFGYGMIAVSVFAFIFLFLVPVIKMRKAPMFMTNVNDLTARKAKKHNRDVRNQISDKMIEIVSNTEGLSWYGEKNILDLAEARKNNDDKQVKAILTKIYDTDVRKTSKDIITSHAVQVGITTALSQSERLDVLFVSMYELKLIKDLVYLYGYRPSDAELGKIYTSVLNSALLAYGAQSVSNNLVPGLAGKISDSLAGLPLLGEVISTVVGSVSQGIINSSITVIIGEQTKRYLKREYHLQDVLDEIDLPENEDEEELLETVKSEVMKNSKSKKK